MGELEPKEDLGTIERGSRYEKGLRHM